MSTILVDRVKPSTVLPPDLAELAHDAQNALRYMGVPVTERAVVRVVGIVRHDGPDAVDQVRRSLAVRA